MRPAVPDVYARWTMAAWTSLAIPIAAVWIWRSSWWPLALFVVWTFGAATLSAVMASRKWKNRSARMLDHAQLMAIRTLSHHRHDWMNELQIMYGYLRLNKPDRATEIVERIRERMDNESRISGLGHAELSMFLLSFRTTCDQMRLDVQVQEGLSLDRLPIEADKLASSLIGLIRLFQFRAAPSSRGAENVLRLKLTHSDDALRVELEYEGEWAARQRLAQEAADLLAGLGQLTEEPATPARPGEAGRLSITYPLAV